MLVYLLPLKVSEINTFLFEDLAVVWMFSDLPALFDTQLLQLFVHSAFRNGNI